MILGRKRCWYKQHIWLATWRRRPTQPPDLRCEKCGHKRVSESPLRRLHPCWGRDHPVQPRLSSQTNMHHVSLFHLNPFCFSLVSPSLSFFIFSLLQNMSPYHSKSSLSFSLNAKSMISGGGTKFLNILFIYILHLVNQQIATLMLLSCKVPCLLRSQQQVLVHSSPGNVCSAGACDHWPVCRVPGRRCLCCQCPHCPVVPDTVRGVDRRKYLLGTMVGIILWVPSWQPASHQPEIEQKLIWPLSNHRHCHLTNCQQRVILSFLFVEGHFWCSELWESDYLRM